MFKLFSDNDDAAAANGHTQDTNPALLLFLSHLLLYPLLLPPPPHTHTRQHAQTTGICTKYVHAHLNASSSCII